MTGYSTTLHGSIGVKYNPLCLERRQHYAIIIVCNGNAIESTITYLCITLDESLSGDVIVQISGTPEYHHSFM